MQNVQSDNLVQPVFVHKKKVLQTDHTEVDIVSANTATATLTDNQIASNHLLQFLNELCKMDDEITCKQIILNDKLNVSLNIFSAKL